MKLLVTYKMKKPDAPGFLRELSALEIPEVVRTEKGCGCYEYFLPADGAADRVLLVEEWESAELQALHLEQPPHEAPCRNKAALRRRNHRRAYGHL